MKELNRNFSIEFLGGAGTVTGSKYLVRTATITMLVDCGLFQGLKFLRKKNWEPLPISGNQIDYVLLTHGHLDHTGYLPKLVTNGFNGIIIGTAPTLDIAKIILEDSAMIQEEDAERANRRKHSKHNPAQPLYTLEDVKKTLNHFQAIKPNEWINLNEEVKIRLRYNGHILGATFIEVKIRKKNIVFSGDVGKDHDALLFPPMKPEFADVLLIESTYGNKIHRKDVEIQLETLLGEALQKGSTVIIPSFAVERTQTLMYYLWNMKKKGKIPDIPVYLDSPMASKVLQTFIRNKDWHKLSTEEFEEMCSSINYIQSMEESFNLIRSTNTKIVIAGSGMVTGGRVLNYLEHYISNNTATILLIGYQAEGTRGRQLSDGVPGIKFHGNIFPVKANIRTIDGLSSHADQEELLNWVSEIKNKPEQIFIVHGEKESSEVLKNEIQKKYGWSCIIPRMGEVFTL